MGDSAPEGQDVDVESRDCSPRAESDQLHIQEALCQPHLNIASTMRSTR